MAAFFLRNRDLESAGRYIEKALKIRPKYAPARLLKAELLIKRHKPSDAIFLLNELIKDEPNSPSAHYLKGLAHAQKGETDLAKEEFAKAFELNPRDIRPKLLISEIYLKKRNFDLAKKTSKEVLKLIPNNLEALLILGNASMAKGEFKEAQSAFKKIIDLYPNNPQGYFRMGLLYRVQKKYDLAMQYFQKAEAINPRLLDVFTNMALVHVEQGHIDTAIEKCDRQLAQADLSPNYRAVIYNLKAGLLAAQKKYSGAEASYKTAIRENPVFLPPYLGLARLYLIEKKTDQAIAQYKQLLKKRPKSAYVHMLLGTIYDMQHRYDLSEKHYRAALKINPDFMPAANNLAFLLAEQGKNLDEALALAQNAKEKLPDDPNITDTLGWVYYKKGLYDSAKAQFLESLKKLDTSPAVHYHLGMTLYKKGEREAAKRELEKALAISRDFPGAKEAEKILAKLQA